MASPGDDEDVVYMSFWLLRGEASGYDEEDDEEATPEVS
jgi:hypothetical protein